MRVLHVITRLIVGGAQENTLSSVLGLRERHGMDVRLVSGPTTGPEGTLEPLARAKGAFTRVPSLVRPIHPFFDPIALVALWRIFRAEQPDIVHTHSGKAGLLGRVAARAARTPAVLHTIHGPSFGPFHGPLANALLRGAERLAGTCTDHFVVVADAMARQYQAAGIGRPEQFTRIFSGFDLDPFLRARNDPALRARLGLAPDDFVIGKIARLFKLKGHDDLLRAAPEIVRRIPNARFLLVGDGAWRDRLTRDAQRLGLADRFVFAGLVPPTEVPAFVGVMDVLVHLSRREGLARALPQAMAGGKPVVAFDCDGAREVCLHDETGRLVAPGDLKGLVESLALLAAAPRRRAELGERGRRLVIREFPVERMIDALRELYLRIAAEKDFGRRSPMVASAAP